jgi:hypothetical protein
MPKYREYPKVVVDAQLPTELKNRALDIRVPDSDEHDESITLKLIDTTIVNHFSKIMPQIQQDGQPIDVPVMYAGSERWKQIQTDGVIRDKFDKIQLPVAVINRTSIEKANINSAVNQYNVYTVQQKYNSRNAYDKFNVLNRVTPSEKYYSMMIPDYYNIVYSGMLWTQYVEHMNALTEAIAFESNTYWGNAGDYRFRTEIDQFTFDVDLPPTDDRMVRTSFTMSVFGYLLPQFALDKNGLRAPVTQIGYTPKKLITFVEVVSTGETYETLGDIPPGEE